MTKFLLAAGLSLGLTSAASAATLTFTEGNGDNRARVAGSIDLEDAPSGSTGFDLDFYNGGSSFGPGDTIGIYGRIVGAVDRFTYSFSSVAAFDVSFDFDGYDLQNGGSVAAGYSGLIDQSVVTGGGDPTSTGGKGVRISLLDDLLNEVAATSFVTNVTSLTAASASIFSGIAAGTYTLVVDGSNGPNKSTAALYDIEVSAVPLPLSGMLLLSGLGSLAVWRRRKPA